MTADTVSNNETPPEEKAQRLPSINWLGWVRGTGELFLNALAQARVLERPYGAVMHLLIFWGILIQLVGTAVALMQMKLFTPFELTQPRSTLYLRFELLMDLAGIAIVVGVGMAFYRRYVMRPKNLETQPNDVYILVMLLLIALGGFVSEAFRFVASSPDWAKWSPVGYGLAELLDAGGLSAESAADAHAAMFWVHTLIALTLVATAPFTKLRHVLTAPLNIVVRPKGPDSALTPIPDIEEAETLGVGDVIEFEPQQLLAFDTCVRCGRCDDVCPATSSGLILQPRLVVQELRSAAFKSLISTNGKNADTSLEGNTAYDMAWYCTTCGACLKACPVFVNPVGAVFDLRRYHALTTGDAPGSIGAVLRNFEVQNNPWGLPSSDRTAWTEGLDVRVLEPGEDVDVLFYVGCAAAYDDRSKKATRAFVGLLQNAGVDFAILGDAESCCGETARRMGNEYLFQVFAGQNIEVLAEYNFQRIVTQCPHCYNTLKHEYPQLGGHYRVQHYTEFLAEIAARLPGVEMEGKITYHDPCYLGRYNGVFNPPRQLLDTKVALQEGNTRVEMQKHHANSFCCGGGGGQTWMETDADKRINNNRLQQAVDVGANTVVTACPYCLLMLDDAVRSTGKSEEMRVVDLAEALSSQSKD